jgi:hypothetical protein
VQRIERSSHEAAIWALKDLASLIALGALPITSAKQPQNNKASNPGTDWLQDSFRLSAS